MIPKVIHCVWFGGKSFPPLDEKCFKTWKKYLPDYEIKIWNEESYDCEEPFFQKLLKNKKWAFCADYARLDILLKHGGIYLDTDMEVLKSLDTMLNTKCFLGMESESFISAGIIGCEKNNGYIKDCLKEVKASLLKEFIPIPKILTRVYQGGQYSSVTIYPKEYFYPYNPFAYEIKNLMFMDITDKTHAIHHWNYSWKPSISERIYAKLRKILKF